MSSSPPSTPPPSPEFERLQRELIDKSDLVQQVREELIRSQITVLELQDSVLQKETDKADAVAILGQAELVLEGKINYIFELDRVLNERIAALKNELAAERSAHETITTDLVQKLDQTNRDLGAAHALAGNYAREAAEAREKLASALHTAQQQEVARHAIEAALSTARAEKTALDGQLNATSSAKAALEQELATLHQSFAWKITSLFRPARRTKP